MSYARALSLFAAVSISLLVLVYPFAFGRELSGRDHWGASVLLMGVSAAYVHGFGYVPERRIWRWTFQPAVAWTLIAAGLALLSS